MAFLGLGWRSIAGSFLLSTLLWHTPAAAQETIPEEAKLYFKNGVELIQGQPPNYQDAYYQFKLAWEKSKSWKVLGNWGLCALKLERDGEAIWAYTEYLKQSGKDIDPEERTELERDLLLLNGNAASIDVSSDVADLELVDTRAGSAAPPQTYRLQAGALALRLRAGSHTLTATSQGKSLRWEVTLSPGKVERHRFEFAAAPASPPPPALGGPAPVTSASTGRDVPQTSGGTVRVLGYVVAGAGLLTLGGGLFVGSQAKSQESEARKKCETRPLTGLTCPESTRGDFDNAQNKAGLANVLMIAGGAVAAGGVVMILVGGPKRRAPVAGFTLTPLVGRRDGGLLAQGRF